MHIDLVARVGCYPQWGIADDHHERISRFLADVLPLSGHTFAPGDRICSPVALNIEHVPLASIEHELSEVERAMMRFSAWAELAISTSIDVDPAGFEGRTIVRREDTPNLLHSAAVHRLDEAISALAFSTALAQPGEMLFVYSNFTPVSPAHFHSNLPSASFGRGIVLATEIGWPRIRRLPIRQVVEWLEALNGWSDGIGRGHVGRAVAALSHALSRSIGHNTPLRLMWGMVGLEALYCRGKEGLKSQVSERAQLLLGALSSHKKRIGQLYDYRSSFLHGSLDIPFAQREREDDEDVMQFLWQSDDESSLAVIALLASIQELIARGWHDIEFRTSIVPPATV
jgi:hypothetical protein